MHRHGASKPVGRADETDAKMIWSSVCVNQSTLASCMRQIDVAACCCRDHALRQNKTCARCPISNLHKDLALLLKRASRRTPLTMQSAYTEAL